MDNTTAVAYLNMGGIHSPQLLQLTLVIWEWCENRKLFLLAQHIPRKSNVEADRESRVHRDLSDWKLSPTVIAPLIKHCQVDLFTSRLTHQLKQYVSWRPDPTTIHVDVFTMNWSKVKGYVFPPFNLIPAVLYKTKNERVTLVLVEPPFGRLNRGGLS